MSYGINFLIVIFFSVRLSSQIFDIVFKFHVLDYCVMKAIHNNKPYSSSPT